MSTLALLAASFATSFVTIFLRGFQQKNVHGNHKLLAYFTAYLIIAGEFVTVTLVVRGHWWIVFSAGTGAGLGMVAAMTFHDRIVRKK